MQIYTYIYILVYIYIYILVYINISTTINAAILTTLHSTCMFITNPLTNKQELTKSLKIITQNLKSLPSPIMFLQPILRTQIHIDAQHSQQ